MADLSAAARTAPDSSSVYSPKNSRQRLLDPVDRLAEVLCGLIMVMTFTLAMKRAGWSVREVLEYAIGCNVAWGIIDGSLYTIGCISERGRNMRVLESIRTVGPEAGRQVIRAHLPPVIAGILTPSDYENLRQKLRMLPDTAVTPAATKEDLLGGLGVFLLVFLSTLPVVIPFLVIENVRVALSASHGVALVLLFLTGFFYGRATGSGTWKAGCLTLAIGIVLTIVALVLGG